jgi:two-component system NtrC family sensor kinase
MNLLSNSIDAIEGEGTIKIITKIYDPKQIQIILSDTGKGMTPEVSQKIFDPFFTTKNVGDGTGLGLSISYGIIKEMQGSIEFTSEVDKGTTFIINLPI